MESNGLTHDLEIAIKLLKMTADPIEALQDRGAIVGLSFKTEELIKRRLDDRCLAGAGTLGGGLQSPGNMRGEMSGYLWLHG